MTALTIQSIGAPPERHADRIVAEMLKQLAAQRATYVPAIVSALVQSSDGGPRAQRRMAERAERAGAFGVDLIPGKRGRYELSFFHLAGWDPTRDADITPSDPIPAKPWIVCHYALLESKGRGSEERKLRSAPILFVTHHALSRVAQRCGAMNSRHLINATTNIFQQMLHWQAEELEASGVSVEQWLADIPPEGYRVQVARNAPVVFKRHETRKTALVAATIFEEKDRASEEKKI